MRFASSDRAVFYDKRIKVKGGFCVIQLRYSNASVIVNFYFFSLPLLSRHWISLRSFPFTVL
jgi:hypothetical protein